MDNQIPTVQEIAQPQRFKILSYINPRQNFKGFIASFFLLFAILGVSTYSATTGNKTPDKPKEETETAFVPISNNTIVYGYWTEENSKIEAADLQSGKIYEVASLGKDIKKVTIVSSNNLIFINKTNDRDHGKEIASYNVDSKSSRTIVNADNEFGIDDYVISPNKKYISTWEIKVNKDSGQLIGGRSRVYTVDIASPSQKNLIYDEPIVQGVPVSYPIGITDSGELFLDKFKANDGAGWANGMTASNFSGNQKQDLASMQAGTYSTQPAMSPDGKYLAFAGYDGNKGNGITENTGLNGFRQSVLSPNTVEILDSTNKQRIKLPNLSSSNIYPGVSWDKFQSKLIFSEISKGGASDGSYIASIRGSSYERINIKGNILSILADGKILVAVAQTSQSAVGNLGEKYTPSLTSISSYDNSSGKNISIDIGKPIFQYIDIKSNNYFRNATEIGKIGKPKDDISHKQLQLQTFSLKPSLAPKREVQQSEPKCTYQTCPRCFVLAIEQCNLLLGTNYGPGSPEVSTSGTEFDKCQGLAQDSIHKQGLCWDSPLFLYGKEGTRVDIKIGTKIFLANPASNGEYSVVLGKDGKFNIGNRTYSKIDFGYSPAISDIPKLNYGRVVDPESVDDVISEYGDKLGLKREELEDIKNAFGKLNSPYVHVSFYKDHVSKRILPISFIPEPDNYRNIIFYIKPLIASVSIAEPIFDKIPQRKGFTAVEVSYVIAP